MSLSEQVNWKSCHCAWKSIREIFIPQLWITNSSIIDFPRALTTTSNHMALYFWALETKQAVASVLFGLQLPEWPGLFVFKSLNSLAPSYLSELNLNKLVRCLWSTNNNTLSHPRTRLKLRGDRVFAVSRPRLWNSLPLSLRSVPSGYEFKLKLKSHLITQAFKAS